MLAESQLIARVIADGDPRAFGFLVRSHQGKLRGFLRRLTKGDTMKADDLAQETFLMAHKKIRQYSGEGSFFGWLCQIGYRLFLQDYRKEKRRAELAEQNQIEADTAPPPDALSVDVERAMAKLSDPERTAITLCHTYGLTNDEAARVMDMPVGTVKSHLHRGRETLKIELAAWQERTIQ